MEELVSDAEWKDAVLAVVAGINFVLLGLIKMWKLETKTEQNHAARKALADITQDINPDPRVLMRDAPFFKKVQERKKLALKDAPIIAQWALDKARRDLPKQQALTQAGGGYEELRDQNESYSA